MNICSSIGTHDLLFITLDTLRYDVAQVCLVTGQTPNLARLLPGGVWECRLSPANFTDTAHQAFLAGFLPTPISYGEISSIEPGQHQQLFNENTAKETCGFETADIVSKFAQHGYHTICIGGTSCFNKQDVRGNVLPSLFAESHWHPSLSVTDRDSTENQVKLAIECLAKLPSDRRVFLFMNISALHQPTWIFSPGESEDSLTTQAAALAYVDRQLPPLFQAMQRRAPIDCIICADRGMVAVEDSELDYHLSRSAVGNVPYAEFTLPMVAS